MTLKAQKLFPPRPKSAADKKPGVTPMLAFRAPDDIRKYMTQLRERGYSTTEVIIGMLRMGIELERELSDLWPKIRATAELEGATVGMVISRMLRDSMKGAKR